MTVLRLLFSKTSYFETLELLLMLLIIISMLFAQCNPARCTSGACSQYGWCGIGPAYETNCQKAYSAPNRCPPVSAAINSCPVSVDGTCGFKGITQFVICLVGMSCSQYGYCGTGSQYTANSPAVPAVCNVVTTTKPAVPVTALPSPTLGPFTNLITPYSQCIQPNHVALTMDDGPSNDITPLVFAKLISKNIPVTFFEIGKTIETNTVGVTAMKNAIATHPGLFSIAIHTYHHWNSSDIMKKPASYNSGYQASTGIFANAADALPYKGMTSAQILAYEITRTSTIIKNTYGVTPNFLRPPYGECNFGALDVFNSLKIYTVVWSVDTSDFNYPTNQVKVQSIFDTEFAADPSTREMQVVDTKGVEHFRDMSVNHGPIILSHDLYRVFTIDTLDHAIAKYAAAKKTFVSLETCLNLPVYK